MPKTLERTDAVAEIESRTLFSVLGSRDGIAAVHDEAEFVSKLSELQDCGSFPVVLSVNTWNEPFFSESGSGELGRQLIRVIEYSYPLVQVEWQADSDKRATVSMSVHDLFIAMLDPQDAIAYLQQDVQKNREDGSLDVAKEAALLRLKYYAGQISDRQYEQGATKLIARVKKYRDEHHVVMGAVIAQNAALKNLITTLPFEHASRLMRTEQVFSENEHDMLLEIIGAGLLCRYSDLLASGQETAAEQAVFVRAQREFYETLNRLPLERQTWIRAYVKQFQIAS